MNKAGPTHSGVETTRIAEHLSAAIRFKTVSCDDPAGFDSTAFDGLHGFLRETYPLMHDTLEREDVGRHSLLYSWQGSEQQLEPLLILSHQDVVPAPDETGWTHPPFSGAIAGGAVWGRGAIDVKGSLVAICEAVEGLIAEGFRPSRTILLAFGHDEETGGLNGAKVIGDLLTARGVKPSFISDEGGAILTGVVPGVKKPVALVGIAEKGYVSLALKVAEAGGHASMPPRQTAIGILAAAIARIEANPFPPRVSGITLNMLDHLRPEMPLLRRIALRNRWLFEPMIRRQLDRAPASAATLRTTTAVTMIRSGVKDNILPAEATAVLNVRIIPGDRSDSVMRRLASIIADERVRISVYGQLRTEPSPTADVNSNAFELMRTTLRQVAPDSVPAPFLLLGGTDSRHYAHLTPAIFRFSAIRLDQSDLNAIHGQNERMTIDNCVLQRSFYVRLIRNADSYRTK